MFDKSTRSKQVCQLLLSLIVGYRTPIACVAGALSNKGSLGPGSVLGEKEKKSSSEASREVIWEGERAPPHQPRPQGFSLSLFPLFFKGKALGTRLPPHTTARFASLADIFPKWPRFFAFFHHCGTWSQAKIKASCLINAPLPLQF